MFDTRHLKLGAVLILALSFAACGESEAPAPVSETTPDVEAPGAVAETPAETEAPADEVQSVVEESAAEPEPEEKAIVLAQSDAKPSQQKFKYVEGTHFSRFVPTQPTVGGPDKVEVAEFFWFGCPHCYSLEPYLARWESSIPQDVRLVRVPVTWNRAAAMHAKMFYTAESLAGSDKLENLNGLISAAFEEFHQRGNRLLSEAAMKRLFARFGVSEEDFDAAWNSFDVDRRMRIAEDLTTRYSIDSVPAIVVNGKFKTNASQTGGNDKLIEAIDELVARETVR